MAIVNFEYGTLIHGRRNSLGTFDADIDPDVRNRTTNADLTLYLRINFQQINPSSGSTTYNDSDNNAVPIRAWRPTEWREWKRRFLSDCRRRWNGRFWLRTPDAYDRLNWPRQGPTHRCNLYCRFEIEEQATQDGAHAVIPVVRVRGNHFFRSHMLLYSHRDVWAERLTEGTLFYTHVHEIGHLIGLDHPGISLPGCQNGGEPACYASLDGDDRGVMGRGSRVYERHAEPWRKAAAILTGTRKSDWGVSLRRVRPRAL